MTSLLFIKYLTFKNFKIILRSFLKFVLSLSEIRPKFILSQKVKRLVGTVMLSVESSITVHYIFE